MRGRKKVDYNYIYGNQRASTEGSGFGMTFVRLRPCKSCGSKNINLQNPKPQENFYLCSQCGKKGPSHISILGAKESWNSKNISSRKKK